MNCSCCCSLTLNSPYSCQTYSSHWYLAVICFPSLEAPVYQEKDQQNSEESSVSVSTLCICCWFSLRWHLSVFSCYSLPYFHFHFHFFIFRFSFSFSCVHFPIFIFIYSIGLKGKEENSQNVVLTESEEDDFDENISLLALSKKGNRKASQHSRTITSR